MLRLDLLFLVIALGAISFGFAIGLVMAFFGFAGLASLLFEVATLLFVFFLVLAGVFFIAGFFRRTPPQNLV